MTRADLPARSAGFTLTELAVAIAIIGLLLGGLLIPLSSQVELSQARETQRDLESAREALIGFAIARGRLPCPADPTLPTGTANAGRESRSGSTCSSTVMHPVFSGLPWGNAAYATDPRRANGALPWADLGLPETDAWGRRFTYTVEEVYANDAAECANPPLTTPAPTLCPDNASPSANLRIAARQAAGTTTDQARNIVAIVVSHGKNGYWAYTPTGGQVNTGASPSRDERYNGAWNTGTGGTLFPYVMQRPLFRTDAVCNDLNVGSPLCEFDDQVVWIGRNMLVARMAAANRF